jgi:hypothetical protein
MQLPKRRCSSAGCPRYALAKGSHCVLCQKLIDSRRGSPSRRGYDEQHRRLRILCFQRDDWKCVDCGWEPDTVRDARAYDLGEPPTDAILAELLDRWHRGQRHLHGDHDVPIQTRPDLRRDLDNYKTRCNECHSAKTMREQHGT